MGYCWRTLPTAEFDASVVRLVSALSLGCSNRNAYASASLMVERAQVVESSHERCSVNEANRELSGSKILAHPCMKRW